MGYIVGPDGKGGEALYFNFNQISGLLFLVQVNPNTGEARQFNAPQGPGAWALIKGPDEKIYLGTSDGTLVLRFDSKQPEKGLVGVTEISPGQFQFTDPQATNSSQRFYGVRSPSSASDSMRFGALGWR